MDQPVLRDPPSDSIPKNLVTDLPADLWRTQIPPLLAHCETLKSLRAACQVRIGMSCRARAARRLAAEADSHVGITSELLLTQGVPRRVAWMPLWAVFFAPKPIVCIEG